MRDGVQVRDGRIWLITGCSSGLGQEMALAALSAGDRVMLTARDPKRLARLAELAPERTRVAELDVTCPEQVDAVVQATIDRFGSIDVLVNNAGYGVLGAVEELSMEQLRDMMEVMFFGAVHLTKAVLPYMRRNGSGSIVQMSSQGGQMSPPGFGGYCATKFALEGISEALATEVAPFGIRVLLVEPGAFRTRFHGRVRLAEALNAYTSVVNGVREDVLNLDGAQPGDPARAAAILQVLDSAESPLRLALGRDAVDNIRAHHRWARRWPSSHGETAGRRRDVGCGVVDHVLGCAGVAAGERGRGPGRTVNRPRSTMFRGSPAAHAVCHARRPVRRWGRCRRPGACPNHGPGLWSGCCRLR
jgi:NAD(P)-dependent dehydrogenase (short-subunit alcohol dehydrogenase family)